MSCFEQSEFVKNPTMFSSEMLVEACNQLGWRCQRVGEELQVFYQKGNQFAYNDPVLYLSGNTVRWNKFYQRDGRQKVEELREAYEGMLVAYAYKCVMKEFVERGFSFVDDLRFTPDAETRYSFYFLGKSKLKNETEASIKIHFKILSDGVIRTDSDYIPQDVHLLADAAMAAIERHYGCVRTIQPKQIPAKYMGKTFCHAKPAVQLKQKRS